MHKISPFIHFFYKSCRHPAKRVMFSDSKYNVLTIHISFTSNAATASFVIICRACSYFKTTEFLCKEIPCIKLCIHVYSCTCPDNENGNLCKHIHRIHAVFQNEDVYNVDIEDDCIIVNNPISTTERTQTKNSTLHKVSKINHQLRVIEEQITKDQVQQFIHNYSAKFNLPGNDACLQMKDVPTSFKKTEKITSNAKNQIQYRFKQTRQNPGRKHI